MIRIYTFTVEPPAHVDLTTAATTIAQHLTAISANSKELLEAGVEVVGEQVVMTMTYQGRDRWYIHKKIKFPLVATLRKADMKMEHVRSTQISVPESGRDRPTPRVPPPL